MNIEDKGKKGEDIVRKYLSKKFGGWNLSKPDWEVYNNGKYYSVEVKFKDRRFNPPPFLGHGLDLDQIEKRMKRYEKTGIRNYLLIVDWKEKELLGQWLDVLESGKKDMAPFGKIRVYPIECFEKLEKLQ